jgi:hypothetical protein
MNRAAEELTEELGLPPEDKYEVLATIYGNRQIAVDQVGKVADQGQPTGVSSIKYVRDQLGRIVRAVIMLVPSGGVPLGQALAATRGDRADESENTLESQVVWGLPALQVEIAATMTEFGGTILTVMPIGEARPDEQAKVYEGWALGLTTVVGLSYGPKRTNEHGLVEFEELAFDVTELRRAALTVEPASSPEP